MTWFRTMASIRQRPDGAWRARYRDAAGKEHARHFALKRDAQRWLNEVTASVVTGQYADPRSGRISWDEWVQQWMDAQTWATATHEAAASAVASVTWGSAPLRSVKQSQVQGWVTAELRRGVAASTMKMRLSFVQMAFRAAVRDKVIATSPADGVKPPRQRRREASMKILTIEQLASAIAAAGEFRGFVAVCAFAGLRLGEAAGLQLGDVDFLRRTITVARQVRGNTIKTTEIVPPKAGSERVISVPDELLKLLSAHVAAEGIMPGEHLFQTPLGRLYHRASAAVEWKRVREAAGIPADFTLHALRHTYASSLIASGCDVVTVQRALGHAQPSITLNVYSHLWPSAEDKTRTAAADLMASVAVSADSVRTGTGKSQVSSL